MEDFVGAGFTVRMRDCNWRIHIREKTPEFSSYVLSVLSLYCGNLEMSGNLAVVREMLGY